MADQDGEVDRADETFSGERGVADRIMIDDISEQERRGGAECRQIEFHVGGIVLAKHRPDGQ